MDKSRPFRPDDLHSARLRQAELERSPDTLSTDSANENHLQRKYQRLKATFDQLLDSATQNQQTQEKFYELELYFLQAASFDELIKRIVIDLKTRFKVDQLSLVLLDPNAEIRQLLKEIYSDFEYEGLTYVDTFKALESLCSESHSVKLSQDPKIVSQALSLIENKSNSVAILPLTRNKQLIGTLQLGSFYQQRFSPSLATHFLQHLASIISVCIESSLNQERYKHLSLVDMLTRTKNRRYFFQAMAQEIARSIRANQPVACLFLDIDFFKKINDVFGHSAGDMALKLVAKQIQTELRQSDILARFGGEEFTVLLPATQLENALEIAERIRQTIANSKLKMKDGAIKQLTVSIGVSNWIPSNSEETPSEIQEKLINQADKAVYQAKSNGRNQVVCF